VSEEGSNDQAVSKEGSKDQAVSEEVSKDQAVSKEGSKDQAVGRIRAVGLHCHSCPALAALHRIYPGAHSHPPLHSTLLNVCRAVVFSSVVWCECSRCGAR
jgi:hypothetical protein